MRRVPPAPPAAAPPSPASARTAPGRTAELAVSSRPLHATVGVTLWTPPGAADGEPLPVLAVHDGPEYVERTRLTDLASGWIAEGRAPAHRIALLHPGEREEWYSASALYARALLGDVLPAVAAAAPVAGRPIGVGASLGALAMLHAQRLRPSSFGALFLQSGSFFRQRWDRQESGFARFRRISRFVGAVLNAPPAATRMPVTLTCGAPEENLANNRAVATALRRQGHAAALHVNRDAHNWIGWRDTLDPHLVDLLARSWG
jgi:enterochelin esterase-like enzyme